MNFQILVLLKDPNFYLVPIHAQITPFSREYFFLRHYGEQLKTGRAGSGREDRL